MKPKIYVIGQDSAYVRMFMANNWEIVTDPRDADAIQFTGGEDVSPMLYDEPRHPTTGNNVRRDDYEAGIFNEYKGEKSMLGVCRGGQFLTVMNGGRLWQDVDNHGVYGGHFVQDLETGEMTLCSSTHHQMMDPSPVPSAKVLAVAGRTTYKSDGWGVKHMQDVADTERDIEAVYFPETDTICFQAHPEFYGPDHECQILYFRYIEEYLGLKGE